jgi:quercetin dioxygenase-like cupin family protein
MKDPKRVLFLLIILAVTSHVRAESSDAEGYRGQVQITTLLRTTTTAADQPIVYPQTTEPEVSILLVEIPPGGETGWHKHPYPILVYSLLGELAVDFENGKTHVLSAGEAMVECMNLFHNGRNIGKDPVKLVISVMGEKGKPFTVHKEESH